MRLCWSRQHLQAPAKTCLSARKVSSASLPRSRAPLTAPRALQVLLCQRARGALEQPTRQIDGARSDRRASLTVVVSWPSSNNAARPTPLRRPDLIPTSYPLLDCESPELCMTERASLFDRPSSEACRRCFALSFHRRRRARRQFQLCLSDIEVPCRWPPSCAACWWLRWTLPRLLLARAWGFESRRV